VARFAGHEADFAALLDHVPSRPAPGLGRPVVIGIFGPGGVGKTVLATHLAHAVAGRYPDGQLFVELRGASLEPADPGKVLRRLLHALGVPGPQVPEDTGARQAVYRSLLADRRVLIMLDDAGSEAQVRPLIPAGRGCLVLVTARPSLAAVGMTARCDLEVLADAAALALLASIAGSHERLAAEPEAAAEVVRHCGHLPLALAVAGARLRDRPQWRVVDLAHRLADERRRLDELHAGHLDVRASIGLSYADLDPTAACLFRRLSLLGYATFGPGVAAMLLGGADRWPASELLVERLADAKLIEPAGPRRYRFHDLVRLYAQERLEAEEPPGERRAALLRSLDYYRDRAREQWRTLNDPAASTAERAQAGTWFERTRDALVSAARQAEEEGEDQRAGELAAAAAPYLRQHGDPAGLAAVAEVAARAARATGDGAALARALADLGRAAARDRPDEAQRHYADSLRLFTAVGDGAGQAEVRRELARLDAAVPHDGGRRRRGRQRSP
jgi:hypothetical protein